MNALSAWLCYIGTVTIVVVAWVSIVGHLNLIEKKFDKLRKEREP